MESLIGLTLLGLLWLISSPRWQKRFYPFLITIALLLLINSAWGQRLVLWGLTVNLPPDSGEPVDAIVVLGRGNPFRDSRTVLAQELWKADRASQLFVSGMLDARPIVQALKDMGVPAQKLSGEECSQSTEENAVFTSALLRPQGVQKILLVTDSPHMLRSLLTFRSVGFQVVPHASSLPADLSTGEQGKIVWREYLALIQYAVTGQFKPRISEPTVPPAEITQKIAAWGCKA